MDREVRKSTGWLEWLDLCCSGFKTSELFTVFLTSDSPNRHLDAHMIVKHTHSDQIFWLQPHRRASLSSSIPRAISHRSFFNASPFKLKHVWVNKLKRKEWKWLGVAVYTVSQNHWDQQYIVYRKRDGYAGVKYSYHGKYLTNSIKSGAQSPI